MKLYIGQPKLEKTITQLEQAMRNYTDIDVIIYPEGYLNENIEGAQELAKAYSTSIITGYRKPKDWAIIINDVGEIILNRAKYEASPVVQINNYNIGFMLCDELVLQGTSKITGTAPDLIIHPIGVGMFSDEQFDEWLTEAKRLAIESKAVIIGASHADGSYRNCGISIPIAYGIAQDGSEIFVSRNDIRSILYDTSTQQVVYVE
ncbi:hypothetical protein [Paenibacillus camelliae]|uniref:hypothetical protein n=1 Tax=Paenibacillus camelliae TaxID=512410 RepID=UPI00203E6E77|nr:hypothetical protein [Paenibacillus camelliae]MCM3633692.1 hypothetical protein [Paenibacillus camelliae]